MSTPLQPSLAAKRVNGKLIIRRATELDAEPIARLSSTLGYATTVRVMRRRIDAILASDADLVLLAARSTGAVVGWLQAHAAHLVESGFRVEITGLIVAAEARRCGVGRALVAEAERWAGAKSAEAIVVRSNARRVESHRFYPALGYRRTKTQTVYQKALAKNA